MAAAVMPQHVQKLDQFISLKHNRVDNVREWFFSRLLPRLLTLENSPPA